jgi:hypothetical protein
MKKYRLALLTAFGLFLAGVAPAQMTLVSSFPKDGAVAVDTSSVFSLSFSQAVDTTAEFEWGPMNGTFYLALNLYPDKYEEPDSIKISSDFTTVYFHNLHLKPETRYVFLLIGAKSTTGDSLQKPAIIHFTTGPDLPPYKVKGKVIYDDGIGLDPTNTIVGLFRKLGNNGPDYLAATVVSSADGSFTIPYVESGSYLGVAIEDANKDGMLDPMTGDRVGLYDPNHDGMPDSIYVSGDVAGIEIEVATSLAAITARMRLSQTETMAHAWAPDAELRIVYGMEIGADGTSTMWMYLYASPILGKGFVFSTLGSTVLSQGETDEFPEVGPLSPDWINSDAAMAVAENAGGSDFRNDHPDYTIGAMLAGTLMPGLSKASGARLSKWIKRPFGLNYWKGPRVFSVAQDQAYWNIFYSSESTGESFTVLINAVTGAVVGPKTARESLDDVASSATAWAQDAFLAGVTSHIENVESDGRSAMWMYGFYSQSKDSVYISVTMFGMVMFEEVNAAWGLGTWALPANWMDSDDALSIAELNGGSQFRSGHGLTEVHASLMGAYPHWGVAEPLWWFEYDSESDTLHIMINCITGKLITGVESDKQNDKMPSLFVLYQNFPNPFNPETMIHYTVPRNERVQLRVLDLSGREVSLLVNRDLATGNYKAVWDGKDSQGNRVGSGIYLYELKAGTFRQVRRMTLIK